MNKMRVLLWVVFLFLLGSAGSSCRTKTGGFGESLSTDPSISLKDLLSQPKKFEGQTVKVEGTITQECPAGGWFFLEEGNARVFVNLHPSNFAIPQAVGRRAVAEGRVTRQGAQIEIIGNGVELP